LCKSGLFAAAIEVRQLIEAPSQSVREPERSFDGAQL
jgi:hypothetical protein